MTTAAPQNLSLRKKLAFSGIIFFCLFLLPELVLRVLHVSPGPPVTESNLEWGLQVDPTLSWSWIPKPGAECRLEHRSFRWNQQGYRGDSFAETKSADTLRIVCMGDSVTMGWWVGDDQTYCHILGDLLSADLRKKVETINAGVMAYTTFQGLNHLQARILGLKPDVVIFSYNWDDHSPAVSLTKVFNGFDSPDEHAKSDKDLPVESRSRVLVMQFLSQLRIFQLIELGLSKIHPVAKTEKADPEKSTVETDLVRVSLVDYQRNLITMIETARSHRIIPVLLTEISGSEAYADESSNPEVVQKRQPFYNARYNDAIRKIAADRKVVCVDPVAALRAHTTHTLFYDAIHPGPAGHMIIAKELARSLSSQILLTPEPSAH